ncbi:MAG: alpha-ribazole phosphatase [Deltaproteobacteria bacterium]|nr:alpha-ribazole phosphatase [Deltaproteobacteria bacterium]
MENRGTRLFLVRHGEVTNHEGEFRYNGHIDVDLSDLGLSQMKAVAGRLATESIKGIYSSDLIRTMRGASAIAEKHGISPVADKRLKEVAAGRWEGLTFNEVHERFPDESHVRFEDLVNYRIKEGGESLRDMAARVIPALNEIIVKHRGESVAMVAHGGVNRVILCHALNLPLENFFRLEQDYGCMNIIDFYESTALVRLVNGIL